MVRLSGLLRGDTGAGGHQGAKGHHAPAVEYVRGLEERAERLEIEPDPQSVEEYRAIMDDTWPSYVRGATWRGK